MTPTAPRPGGAGDGGDGVVPAGDRARHRPYAPDAGSRLRAVSLSAAFRRDHLLMRHCCAIDSNVLVSQYSTKPQGTTPS